MCNEVKWIAALLAKLNLSRILRDWFAPRIAKKQADADRIASDAGVEALSATVSAGVKKVAEANKNHPGVEVIATMKIGNLDVWMRGLNENRRENIQSVFQEAKDEIKGKNVDSQSVDRDWVARFFDYACDVSNKDVQKIWAKVLSGELERPGQTSLRTLSVLKDMSQKDVNAFIEIMQYRIDRFILDECIINPGHRQHLVAIFDAGLIHSSVVMGPEIKISDAGRHNFGVHGDHFLVIQGHPGTEFTILDLSGSPLTGAGQDLAILCEHKSNMTYLSRVSAKLAKKQCTLLAAPISGRESDGKIKYDFSRCMVVPPVS